MVVGGLSVLGAGLVSIGIPKNSVIEYESVIKSDKFLLIVHGTSETVAPRERSHLGDASCCLYVPWRERLRSGQVRRKLARCVRIAGMQRHEGSAFTR